MKKYKLTLIEIIGVVALIVILALIGIAAYSYAADSSKEKASKATVLRLESALNMLKDQGVTPLKTWKPGQNEEEDSYYVEITFDADDKIVRFGTVEVGEKSGKEDAFKMFARAMDADSIDSLLDKDKCLTDGWGQRIRIRYPGKFNRGGFDIISAGSDGGFGEDSATDPPTDIAKYKDTDGEQICDDVANFL